MSTNNIKDKVVAITGGSSGLGEATAKKLAGEGAKVVIAARSEDKLKNIVAEIEADGGTAAYVTTDVTNRPEVENLVSTTVEKFGRLDVLFSNAGLMAIAPFDELKVDEWDAMIDINVKGVLYGIAAALPVFKEQGGGHFINMASVAGLKVFSPGGAVYSGTKFAVRAISEGLRAEMGANIRTTSIEPGAIDTDLPEGSSHDESREFVKEFYEQAISPNSVANAVKYAIEQPADVDINNIALRPTVQEF